MHELSLAGGILGIVEAAAQRESFARVRQLHLCVPALAGVEVEALRFALQAVAPGTVIEGAELVIDEPAARARCAACGGMTEVREQARPCPHCGAYRLQALPDGGLRVVDLLVA